MSGGNIKVVVRCRPLNSRELARGATCLIRMEGDQTILSRPADSRTGKESEDVKAFTFDKSYWSADKSAPNYADQQTVYNDLGEDLLNHAFDGYNCCIFAYGQTGAGKSYSMMGYGADHGIIPLTCSELFERINRNDDPNLTLRVEVSYIEIYNEKVRDLLNPKNKGNLKVREHPSLGPYVEDLSRAAVNCFDDINNLMEDGNKARTVAATNMNETSSRSHAVFTLYLTQKRHDELTNLDSEKVARISLVDLAGSERANSTGATGARLKEGANINRSLTTLGKVIAGLAEQSINEGKKKKGKEVFVPYRDSVLTWLLKDSLGGNSKTAMIAAISPADYDETLSTLRYADQAKKIKNKAVVNEDPNAKLIRELKDELEMLRDRLRTYAPEEVEQLTANSVYKSNSSSLAKRNSVSVPPIQPAAEMKPTNSEFEIVVDSQGAKKKMTKQEIIDQLQSSEKLLANLNMTWEDKIKKTEAIHVEREKALEGLGISVHKNNVGVYAPKKIPHLVNLNEDPLMSECLMYQIKPGISKVGREDSDLQPDIRLSGSNIQNEHCSFENSNGVVTIHPQADSLTMVNGVRISEPQRLRSGYRIILGDHHIFRFNHPEEVRRERRLAKTAAENAMGNGNLSATTACEGGDDERPESPTESSSSMIGSEIIDWNYARREAVLKYYANERSFVNMKDEDLEKLYDDITRIRSSRRSRSGSQSVGDMMITDDESTTRGSRSVRDSTAMTVVGDGSESVLTDATCVTNGYDRFRAETEQLQRELHDQKRRYEARLSRMSRQFSQGHINTEYTKEQLALIHKVAARWKKLRYVTMAEVVLTNAVLLKEANIISRELNKDVLYQFAIIEDGQFSNPLSYWETTSALHQFETDEDTTLISTPKPCIGVRVIDRKHKVIYVWSLERLKLRLHKMRNLYNFIDRPMYRSHFNWEDPFFENPCPKFTFVGSAATAIRNLAFRQPYESSAEVICRSTGQIKGRLRVLIQPKALSLAIPKARPDDDARPQGDDDIQDDNDDVVQVGQQMLFEVRLLELSGLIDADYNDVHVQFRLSSFGGISAHSTAEKVFATEPISDFENGPIYLNYSQNLSVVVTHNVMDVMLHGMISFEVYGQAQTRVLSQYERWDDQREKPRLADLLAASRLTSCGSGHRGSTMNGNDSVGGAGSDESSSLERRPEEELLSAERHDILAWVQVCELAPNGAYIPVPATARNALDRGVFTLRQGLQRRICLTLSHTSGRQFEWNRVVKTSIGRVRLLDPKGRIIESPMHEDVFVKLLPQQDVVYNNDGTSQLIAQGAWDSSQHESIFLNRITSSNTRILLHLKWEVEADKCSKPIQFSMDIAVQIRNRDSATGRSRLRKLLRSEKQLPKCSAVFLVNLRPPMTRRLSQLWRLNTVSKYVRGEESLGSWRPRGVSLVNDYKHICARIRRKEEVAFTRQFLALRQTIMARGDKEGASLATSNGRYHQHKDDDDALSESKRAIVDKVIDLWHRKHGTDKEIIISQDPPIPGMPDVDDIRHESRSASKLLAEVKLITQTDNVSKRGYLVYQESAIHDKWVKRWLVIRRPYIHIYSNHSETDEHGVINVSSVRVDYNRDLEKMLERPNVFALYTSNNAYTLQAASRTDMIDWISKIDQMFPVDKLKNDTL